MKTNNLIFIGASGSEWLDEDAKEIIRYKAEMTWRNSVLNLLYDIEEIETEISHVEDSCLNVDLSQFKNVIKKLVQKERRTWKTI